MEQLQQAHHEIDRLQGIITRHEGFMFTIRGWLLTVVGGLLAAYYTANVDMSENALRFGLITLTLLFLFVETRHANLVEAVVERIWDIERLIAGSSHATGRWYDGPKVSEACLDGATRVRPHHGMTLVLNLPFYLVVILIIAFATFSLPRKVGTPTTRTTSVAERLR